MLVYGLLWFCTLSSVVYVLLSLIDAIHKILGLWSFVYMVSLVWVFLVDFFAVTFMVKICYFPTLDWCAGFSIGVILTGSLCHTHGGVLGYFFTVTIWASPS